MASTAFRSASWMPTYTDVGALSAATAIPSTYGDVGAASAAHNHDGRYYSSGDSAYFSSITTSFILGFSTLTLSADGPAASIAIGAGSIALSASSILFNGSALGTAAFYASTAFASASHTHTNYVEKAGDTMTGQLVAQNNVAYTTAQVRNIILSPSEPTSTDGANGDIWIVYNE